MLHEVVRLALLLLRQQLLPPALVLLLVQLRSARRSQGGQAVLWRVLWLLRCRAGRRQRRAAYPLRLRGGGVRAQARAQGRPAVSG